MVSSIWLSDQDLLSLVIDDVLIPIHPKPVDCFLRKGLLRHRPVAIDDMENQILETYELC